MTTSDRPVLAIVHGEGSPAMSLPSGATVSNLTINAYNASGDTALQLAGSASHVAITATGSLSVNNTIGVVDSGQIAA